MPDEITHLYGFATKRPWPIKPSAANHSVKLRILTNRDALRPCLCAKLKAEMDVGVDLFTRRNNAIELTKAGTQFYADSRKGISIIDRSAYTLRRKEDEITICCSLSFGVRWLVPALEKFKREYPDIRIRLETLLRNEPWSDTRSDLIITYRMPKERGAGEDVLVVDRVKAMLSPSLLAQLEQTNSRDFAQLPVIQSTQENWDWRAWARGNDVRFEDLQFFHQFDTDDAALRAATAGLGVVLSSDQMAAFERENGLLVDLPDTCPVDLGRYNLITAPHDTKTVRLFKAWLLQEAQKTTCVVPDPASKKI